MQKKILLIRKFCFVTRNGQKAGPDLSLQKLILETDFTDQDVENICALTVRDTVFITKEDDFGGRRTK